MDWIETSTSTVNSTPRIEQTINLNQQASKTKINIQDDNQTQYNREVFERRRMKIFSLLQPSMRSSVETLSASEISDDSSFASSDTSDTSSEVEIKGSIPDTKQSFEHLKITYEGNRFREKNTDLKSSIQKKGNFVSKTNVAKKYFTGKYSGTATVHVLPINSNLLTSDCEDIGNSTQENNLEKLNSVNKTIAGNDKLIVKYFSGEHDPLRGAKNKKFIINTNQFSELLKIIFEGKDISRKIREPFVEPNPKSEYSDDSSFVSSDTYDTSSEVENKEIIPDSKQSFEHHEIINEGNNFGRQIADVGSSRQKNFNVVDKTKFDKKYITENYSGNATVHVLPICSNLLTSDCKDIGNSIQENNLDILNYVNKTSISGDDKMILKYFPATRDPSSEAKNKEFIINTSQFYELLKMILEGNGTERKIREPFVEPYPESEFSDDSSFQSSVTHYTSSEVENKESIPDTKQSFEHLKSINEGRNLGKKITDVGSSRQEKYTKTNFAKSGFTGNLLPISPNLLTSDCKDIGNSLQESNLEKLNCFNKTRFAEEDNAIVKRVLGTCDSLPKAKNKEFIVNSNQFYELLKMIFEGKDTEKKIREAFVKPCSESGFSDDSSLKSWGTSKFSSAIHSNRSSSDSKSTGDSTCEKDLEKLSRVNETSFEKENKLHAKYSSSELMDSTESVVNTEQFFEILKIIFEGQNAARKNKDVRDFSQEDEIFVGKINSVKVDLSGKYSGNATANDNNILNPNYRNSGDSVQENYMEKLNYVNETNVAKENKLTEKYSSNASKSSLHIDRKVEHKALNINTDISFDLPTILGTKSKSVSAPEFNVASTTNSKFQVPLEKSNVVYSNKESESQDSNEHYYSDVQLQQRPLPPAESNEHLHLRNAHTNNASKYISSRTVEDDNIYEWIKHPPSTVSSKGYSKETNVSHSNNGNETSEKIIRGHRANSRISTQHKVTESKPKEKLNVNERNRHPLFVSRSGNVYYLLAKYKRALNATRSSPYEVPSRRFIDYRKCTAECINICQWCTYIPHNHPPDLLQLELFEYRVNITEFTNPGFIEKPFKRFRGSSNNLEEPKGKTRNKPTAKVCRICGKLCKEFQSSHHFVIVRLIAVYLPLIVREGEIFPLGICKECDNSLKDVSKFIATFLLNRELYRNEEACFTCGSKTNITPVNKYTMRDLALGLQLARNDLAEFFRGQRYLCKNCLESLELLDELRENVWNTNEIFEREDPILFSEADEKTDVCEWCYEKKQIQIREIISEREKNMATTDANESSMDGTSTTCEMNPIRLFLRFICKCCLFNCGRNDQEVVKREGSAEVDEILEQLYAHIDKEPEQDTYQENQEAGPSSSSTRKREYYLERVTVKPEVQFPKSYQSITTVAQINTNQATLNAASDSTRIGKAKEMKFDEIEPENLRSAKNEESKFVKGDFKKVLNDEVNGKINKKSCGCPEINRNVTEKAEEDGLSSKIDEIKNKSSYPEITLLNKGIGEKAGENGLHTQTGAVKKNSGPPKFEANKSIIQKARENGLTSETGAIKKKLDPPKYYEVTKSIIGKAGNCLSAKTGTVKKNLSSVEIDGVGKRNNKKARQGWLRPNTSGMKKHLSLPKIYEINTKTSEDEGWLNVDIDAIKTSSSRPQLDLVNKAISERLDDNWLSLTTSAIKKTLSHPAIEAFKQKKIDKKEKEVWQNVNEEPEDGSSRPKMYDVKEMMTGKNNMKDLQNVKNKGSGIVEKKFMKGLADEVNETNKKNFSRPETGGIEGSVNTGPRKIFTETYDLDEVTSRSKRDTQGPGTTTSNKNSSHSKIAIVEHEDEMDPELPKIIAFQLKKSSEKYV